MQTLKETAIRAGEALKLKWRDIDLERKTLQVTPEKGSNPRIFKTSKQADQHAGKPQGIKPGQPQRQGVPGLLQEYAQEIREGT
ncbi:MAG: hypothetical protein ACOC6N_01380 [archaeon]